MTMKLWMRSGLSGNLALLACAALTGLMALSPASGKAEEWPGRPITWIVPYLAGTSPDFTSRVIAEELTRILGQPVIIENKGGAAGNLGARIAANAKPDGYTWVYSASPMASSMKMFRKPGYDVMKDFVHVSRISTSDMLLVVNRDSGIHTVQELIDRMRANPGKLNFGSGGIGSPAHFAAELFLKAAGVKAMHVPYKGASQSTQALLAKEIEFVVPVFTVAYPFVETGDLVALATTGPQRNPKLPDVPTMAEAGVPGVVLESFGGISVPKGTPQAVVERINAAVHQAVQNPEVREKLAATTRTEASTPGEYTDNLRAEVDQTAKVMDELGLQAQ